MTDLTIGIMTCNRPDAVVNCIEGITENVEMDFRLHVLDATLNDDLIPDYDDLPVDAVDIVGEYLSPAGGHQRLAEMTETQYHHTINDDMTPRPGAVEALYECVADDHADLATGLCVDPDGPRDIGREYVFKGIDGRPVVTKRPVEPDGPYTAIDHGEPMYLTDAAFFRDGKIRFDPEIDFLLDQWDFYLSCYNAGLRVRAVIDAVYDHHEFPYVEPSPGAVTQDMWADRVHFFETWGYWPGVG